MPKTPDTSGLSKTAIDREAAAGTAHYAPLPVVISRAKGCSVWDVDGKEYLDFMSAYSAVNAGHGHEKILKVFHEQADRLTLTSRAFYTDKLAPFLETLCEVTGLDRALPMNTGAEAVETAVKAARRWGYRAKGIPQDKAEIIVSDGNFHGRTTTIISFSSSEESKTDFGPLTPGFRQIPFGDAEALRQAITPNTCAFLTEPIQGEGGIIIPEKGWLSDISDICKENNVLLILDEIQCGLGRTGKNLTYQHEDVLPDGVILAKALGGGLMPVSAFVGREDMMALFDPGSHGSTWGGNPLASAVGKAALDVLVDEKLAERSAELGDYLLAELKKINSSKIREIRGLGLWVGLDIDPDVADAHDICLQLLDEGLLTKETQDTVLRLAPPLTITKEQLDTAITKLRKVLSE